MTFWLVIVTFPGGRQMEVTPDRDNRREARAIAAHYRGKGLGAYVVKRHEWAAA